ncbi:MAG: PAS domain-containing protein, partial [Paraglaciecola sp.]
MSNQSQEQQLKKYQLFDKDIEGMFDDITAIACESCNTPFAMLSFIDTNTQWVVSQNGSFPSQIDRKKSFCAHTIENNDLFEIPDTLLDKRTSENEYVLQAPCIRFYTGMPIINSDGITLGSICVLDIKPNVLSKYQKSILRLLAKDILSQLELRKKNLELSKLKELHHLITENNPDLIFAKDSDFKILHANSAFISLYPQEMRDKVIGYTTIEGYNEEEVEAFTAQDRLAFELGQTQTTEKIKFPSGETRTLYTTKTRFEDEAGEAYILGVARDVTEREKLIDKLKKSNADLDEFAYIASHDLKSPLNAIKRLVSWIEEDSKEILIGESLEHFGMIKNRIDRMNSLLKDLLNYSRVGKNDGTPQKLNLKETALNCFELLDLPKDFTIDVEDKELTLP